MQKRRPIVVCFFGDGATEEGACAREPEFRRAQKLPILFVCENNDYAIHSPCAAIAWPATASASASARLRHRGASRSRSGDVPDACTSAPDAAVAAVRRGEGPRFIECMTYRWRDHVGPDEDRAARLPAATPSSTPGSRATNLQRSSATCCRRDLREIDRGAVEREIADAIAFAEASPFPADKEIYDHVFAARR